MNPERNELLFRESHIAIELNHNENWLYVNWRGFVNYELVTGGCEKILHFMKERQCFRILNDNTQVEGMWSAAAKWGGEVWFPALREAGLEYFAWVYSPSVLSRLSTDKTIRSTQSPDYIKTFDDLEQAMTWLRSH